MENPAETKVKDKAEVTMKLHHIGIVVDNIERHAKRYADCLGMQPTSPVELDPIQKVHVQFIAGHGDEVSLELIQPAGKDSPVTNALKKGGGLNHLCFEVADIHRSIAAV